MLRKQPRGTPGYASGDVLRALLYVPSADECTWLETELASLRITLQISRTVEDLVAALVEDPPPRPQFLFADFSAMSPGELLHVHAIREQGWFGTVIAIGKVSLLLRQTLRIERMLAPLSPSSLVRAAVETIAPGAQTLRVPRVTG